MKFTGQAGSISDALLLATTSQRLHKKAPTKLTDGAVRLSVVDGEVRIDSYDRCVQISACAPAKVLALGRVATDAIKTLDLFSNFPRDAEVTMTNGDVACGDSKRYRLPTIPDHHLAELPALPPVADNDPTISLTSNDVLSLLDPLWAAESAASTRHYLASCFWQTVNDELVAVCTDGKMLAQSAIKAPSFARGRDLILPEQTAIALHKLLRTEPATVEVRKSARLIRFKAPRFELVSRLIDFEYPEIQHVIPRLCDATATVSRAELMSSLARLRTVAVDTDDLIALSWSNAGPLEIYIARMPAAGTDVFEHAGTLGQARFVVSRQLLALVVEKVGGELVEIIASNPARLRAVGDARRFALLAHCSFAFEEAA